MDGKRRRERKGGEALLKDSRDCSCGCGVELTHKPENGQWRHQEFIFLAESSGGRSVGSSGMERRQCPRFLLRLSPTKAYDRL